jgi:UDP-sugar pyrophosphorylase
VQRAKQLLKLAVLGANPYEGFRVAEPTDAVRLETRKDFDQYEGKGLEQAANTAFVIVAGGLGERLGYKGIKLALPSDICTETTYLELYVRWILALQSRARIATKNEKLELQFAIMTSDDTDALTRELITKHNRFGMSASQLTVFKQGKVPSLLDNDAHFCLDEKDPFTLDTKPHGHGDVHSLLYKEGIVERWVSGQPGTPVQGSDASVLPVQWIVFFQDTNGLVFHSIVAALGVSAERKLHMNSITVPRAQGDAVGAICTLTREKPLKDEELTEEDLPNQLTINVEYNQLEGLLGKGVKVSLKRAVKVATVEARFPEFSIFMCCELTERISVNGTVDAASMCCSPSLLSLSLSLSLLSPPHPGASRSRHDEFGLPRKYQRADLARTGVLEGAAREEGRYQRVREPQISRR